MQQALSQCPLCSGGIYLSVSHPSNEQIRTTFCIHNNNADDSDDDDDDDDDTSDVDAGGDMKHKSSRQVPMSVRYYCSNNYIIH